MEAADNKSDNLADEVCIVVPCHNEAESLPFFINRMNVIEETVKEECGYALSYVFIDDGSTDETLSLLRKHHLQNPNVHYVSFSRNFGKESGLLAGIETALDITTAKYISVIDADLQDPPELLVDMIKLSENDPELDVVATLRKTRDGEPKIRSAFANAFYRLINFISDVEIKNGARDFRLMKRCVAKAFVSLPECNRFAKGLFPWVGYKTHWIAFENIEREHGSTNWSFLSLFRYALDGIMAFSVVPLEAISVIGIVTFSLSLLFLLFVIVRALVYGDPVAGWPSLVCLITFFSGFQIFCIGFVGLYISKIYTETKKRPAYVVKEKA